MIKQPKIIATLGATVFRVLAKKYNIKIRYKTFRDIVVNYKKEDFMTEEGFYIYPLYHTGGLGLRNRKMAKLPGEPVDDFKRLKELFETI
jgi:uracil-DNA glycosylase